MSRGKIKIPLLFICLFFALVFFYCFFESYWLKITEINVISSDVTTAFDGKKIVFVSDIHQSFYFSSSRTANLVKKINSLAPDVVLFGGDYVDKKSKYIHPCFQELKKVRANLLVAGVLGNHDGRVNAPLTIQAMKEAGIDVLDNQAEWLYLNGQRIKIGGVGDLLTSVQDIRPTIGDVQENDIVILLSHNPDYAQRFRTDRVDLFLSGHTHGGQLTLFGWKAFLISDYSKKHLHGLGMDGSMRVFVSHGVGAAGIPMRFFARPEIVVITLKSH